MDDGYSEAYPQWGGLVRARFHTDPIFAIRWAEEAREDAVNLRTLASGLLELIDGHGLGAIYGLAQREEVAKLREAVEQFTQPTNRCSCCHDAGACGESDPVACCTCPTTCPAHGVSPGPGCVQCDRARAEAAEGG